MSNNYKRMLISKQYLIENDIPPKPRKRSEIRAMLVTMEIGQSIGHLTKKEAAVLRMLAWRAKVEITQRKEPDGTYRIWKIGLVYAVKKRELAKSRRRKYKEAKKRGLSTEASRRYCSPEPVEEIPENAKETLEELLRRKK
jgi:hypothetical protein